MARCKSCRLLPFAGTPWCPWDELPACSILVEADGVAGCGGSADGSPSRISTLESPSPLPFDLPYRKSGSQEPR